MHANYQDFMRYQPMICRSRRSGSLAALFDRGGAQMPAPTWTKPEARGERSRPRKVGGCRPARMCCRRASPRPGRLCAEVLSHPQRGLVWPDHGQFRQRLAAASVGHGRHITNTAAGGSIGGCAPAGRGGRQQEAWPHHRPDQPGRDLMARRASCDGRQQPVADPVRDAQQPGLSSGDHGIQRMVKWRQRGRLHHTWSRCGIPSSITPPCRASASPRWPITDPRSSSGAQGGADRLAGEPVLVDAVN